MGGVRGRYLSKMTWKTKYAKIANRIYDSLERAKTYDGLLPVYLDVWKGEPRGHQYSIGGMSDSYYEYLLKAWILGGKKDKVEVVCGCEGVEASAHE